MERLTKWNGKKWVLPQGAGTHREIAERLAAYENIGMAPETIWQLIKAINQIPDAMQILIKFLNVEE